jgi:pimeloyl-ACP methyl ester carboxylesterase
MRTTMKLIPATIVVVALAFTGTASAALKVNWMPGVSSPGTPAKYDKVGVIKVGPAKAKNVLVLEPGTSAGGAYFVPLAQWIVAKEKGWQVWSVERRENMLEDQSVLQQAKTGKAGVTKLFDYYLGYLNDHSITQHFQMIPTGTVSFAKRWGMSVAVGDLHRVITAAHKLGGKVVLGGHSLGGTVVTAYATWNFGGRAGADDLAGLVYIDGGSFRTAETAAAAKDALATLNDVKTSPWLTFGNLPAPYAGLFSATGSVSALVDPNGAVPDTETKLLAPFGLAPKVPVTNVAQYGYALNVGTSQPQLVAAQAHLGKGLTTTGAVRGWNGAGALTPIRRFATMFSGFGVKDSDGTEWYFPQRLTDDTAAVGNGLANPEQKVLGLKTTMGRRLPRTLLMYGFGAALGGQIILTAAKQLAGQSHIPLKNLTLINRHRTYAHNDPNGAYPHNVFFAHLIPFLSKVAAAPGS